MTHTQSPLWYPYTQHKHMALPFKIEHANGAYLTCDTGDVLLDAISSWWCMIHGYNHPEINAVINDQVSKLPHVMLGGLTHQPALDLAQKLVDITPQGLGHVFFSDSGSVGCEIALKIALQYWINHNQPQKSKFLSLERGYHGDTFGVMAVSNPQDDCPSMHHMFKGVLPRHFFIQEPRCEFTASADHIKSEVALFQSFITANHHEIAAFICEPIMQGAGGFNFYSPEYLNQVVKICHDHDILVIFDEVATGFGRTGKLFATNHTAICPDIMVLGKALTAGYCGHSATLTTPTIFNAFNDDSFDKAFMHGPTFMGNPTACRVALKSIDLLFEHHHLDHIQAIEATFKSAFEGFHHSAIKDIRILGATAAIEVHDASSLKGVQRFAFDQGIWLRPFDRFLYTTPPYVTTLDECQHIAKCMLNWFSQ